MDIVFCTDNNLVRQACVLMTSVLANSKGTPVTFHALLLDVSEAHKQLLKEQVCGRGKILLYSLSAKDFYSLPVHMSYITKGTYLRFFIESSLPKTITKVLYLDIDIAVCGSLESLWDEDISGYSAAAALDVECYDIRRYNRLDYPMQDRYFNAGVLLINLSYWRKNSVSKKSLEYLAHYPEKCLFHDQDALNHVLHGTVKFISSRYNAMYDFFRLDCENMHIDMQTLGKIREAVCEPVIIHYAGPFKPWHTEFYAFHYPFGKVWLCYLEQSQISLPIRRYRRRAKKTFRWLLRSIFIALHLIRSDTEKLIKNYISTENIEKKLLETQHAN